MNRLYYCILFLCPTLLLAQYSPTIESGRPGQAINTRTVGKSVYQVETGLTLGWKGQESELTRDIAETTQLRIGILERLEVSGILIGSGIESKTGIGSSWARGISSTELGARYSLLDNDGWIPDMVVEGFALLKLQDENFRRENTGTRLIVSAAWGLTDRLGITVNLNRIWTGKGGQSTGYASSLGYSLSDRWSTFVEIYGDLSKPATAFYDGGFAFMLSDNVLLDASVGREGSGNADRTYLDFGLSFRLDGRALRAKQLE